MAQAFLSELVDIEILLVRPYLAMAAFVLALRILKNTKKLKIQFLLSTNSTSNSGLNHFQWTTGCRENKKMAMYDDTFLFFSAFRGPLKIIPPGT